MLWFFWLFLLLKNPVLATEATTSATIVINKFQFDPPLVGMKEWVELFNKSDSEIDLNIYQLSDFDSHHKRLIGKIPAGGYFKYEESSGWLNNPGDTIFLKVGESIIGQVEYKIDKNVVVNNLIISNLTNLKGKWIGRSIDKDDDWQVFSDTSPPVGGEINYFDGYKTKVENIGVSITPATDPSGIGSTLIITKISNLINNICENFIIDVGGSLNDGKCYKFEYIATDGVGNTSIFGSDSIVKFDTSKPESLLIKNAWRNILKLKSEFIGVDLESGILGYKYSIVPDNWSYIYNSILNIGYSGDPKSICGKAVNNAGMESDINCLDFIIDLITPKVSQQINPEAGKYKIEDKLKFGIEFDEEISLVGNNFKINLNIGDADFIDKVGNILNFEYEVKSGDLTNNLGIGLSNIIVNGGQISDIAGNNADLRISDLEAGIEIDGVVPLISLVGETYVEIPQFGSYLDLGVTVSDGEITVKNNVDTDLGGIYEINYTVTDEAGNKSFVTRKVKVVDTTAPTIKILNDVEKFNFMIDVNEVGNLEWQGKCIGENNNLITGSNLIKIKNNGDGIYDDCEIRAWDKWGNVGEWQKINSFVIDTTAPIINFISPTPDNNVFVKDEVNIAVNSNEKLKECFLEKENTDNWEGDWVIENGYRKSPVLKNEDLIEKSMWQKINMENDGVLSFRWRVSSEKDWDYLKFYIDGVLINKISGEMGWIEQKYNLNIGEHIIKFIYSKDYSGEFGTDAGWVDEVKISGGGSLTPMNIVDNNAFGKLNNLAGGSTRYKVSCTDLFDNKSVSEERKVIKELEKISENVTPTPTPYSIFKTSAIVPTIKLAKSTSIKATTKKLTSVLGAAVTPTISQTTKLKTNIPWEEIKFWAMGMLTLGATSGVVLLDKKII